MSPHLTLITLGVDDLHRALAFYRDGLRLPTNGIVGSESDGTACIFFNLNPGLKLALYPRTSIARDTGLPLSPHAPTNTTLAHNVPTREAVDALLAQAAAAGAKLIKPAHDTFYGGYAAYFQDPEGHLWEIAFNPHLPP